MWPIVYNVFPGQSCCIYLYMLFRAHLKKCRWLICDAKSTPWSFIEVLLTHFLLYLVQTRSRSLCNVAWNFMILACLLSQRSSSKSQATLSLEGGGFLPYSISVSKCHMLKSQQPFILPVFKNYVVTLYHKSKVEICYLKEEQNAWGKDLP